MYVTRKYKPDRPISHKEAIIMTKQLGMMHILYYMRRQVASLMHDFSHMRELLGNKPPELVILNWLSTENRLFEHLSSWEENYKKDLESKKRKTFNNDTITL